MTFSLCYTGFYPPVWDAPDGQNATPWEFTWCRVSDCPCRCMATLQPVLPLGSLLDTGQNHSVGLLHAMLHLHPPLLRTCRWPERQQTASPDVVLRKRINRDRTQDFQARCTTQSWVEQQAGPPRDDLRHSGSTLRPADAGRAPATAYIASYDGRAPAPARVTSFDTNPQTDIL